MLQSSWNPFHKEDPKELVRKWKASLRSEIRRTEREINALVLEQKKAAGMVKDAAKRNDMKSAKILAKEVVRLRAAVTRMATNKANMLALSNQMTETLALSKAAGTIKATTSVMTTINGLIKVPQLQATMKQMAKEMERSGYIQEMVSTTIDSAIDNEDVEAATDEAVTAVLYEITGETLAGLSSVPSAQIPSKTATAISLEQSKEDDELMERLAGLRAT